MKGRPSRKAGSGVRAEGTADPRGHERIDGAATPGIRAEPSKARHIEWPDDLHARFRLAMHHAEIALFNIQLVGRIDKDRRRHIDVAFQNAKELMKGLQHRAAADRAAGKKNVPTDFELSAQVDGQLRKSLQHDVIPPGTHDHLNAQIEMFRSARPIAEQAIEDGCLLALDEVSGANSRQASADALELFERTESCFSGLELALGIPEANLTACLDRVPGLLTEYQTLRSRLSNAWRLQRPSKGSAKHANGHREQSESGKTQRGWTKKRLCKVGDVSGTTFDRIRCKAKVKPSKPGQNDRLFLLDEIRRLIAAAPTAAPRSGSDAAEAWMALVHDDKRVPSSSPNNH
ncbi:MAG: hypothetical protein KF768_12670 [Phycisphaeraceae bacterium]|nr:hypothetical protein [Phycisphaeraceae bacterium]